MSLTSIDLRLCLPRQRHRILDRRRKTPWVGSSESVDHRARFEDQEGRHGSYGVLPGNVALVVDIDFGECDIGRRVLSRQGCV